jgi:opacity protein-like surface antigen
MLWVIALAMAVICIVLVGITYMQEAKADQGFYGVTSVGGVQVSEEGQSFGSIDGERDTTWTVGLGYEFADFLSAEVDYRSLGKFTLEGTAPIILVPSVVTSAQVNAAATFRGVGISTVWTLPSWSIKPYARAGVFISTGHNSVGYTVDGVNVLSTDSDARSISPLYGVGVSMGMFSIEYTAINDVDSWGEDVDLKGVQVSIRIPF